MSGGHPGHDYVYVPPSRDAEELKEARAEIERLREGGCRFNCRTQRQAFMAGYTYAQIGSPFKADDARRERDYQEWKRGDKQ